MHHLNKKIRTREMMKNTFLHWSFLSSHIRPEYSYYSKTEGRLFIGELVSYPKAFLANCPPYKGKCVSFAT